MTLIRLRWALSVFSVMLWATGVQAAKLPVFVSILPQKYIVQQIGKGRVDVQVMVRPGANPATYEPRPKQMADLSNASIYFAIGVPFESVWLEKFANANPDMRVIHTDRGIEKLAMAAHDHHHDDDPGEGHQESEHHQADHDPTKSDHHGDAVHDEDPHEHAGRDPHIWLSPPLVKMQARTILDALRETDPTHSDAYTANFQAFSDRIDRLDAYLRNIFAGKQGLRFLVFHPAWGYFAHTYGLQQIPIEIEGKEPKPAQLKALIKHAREDGINVIFVQPQFSTKSAELIAREIGGRVVAVDPLAEDWVENLRAVAEAFKAALE